MHQKGRAMHPSQKGAGNAPISEGGGVPRGWKVLYYLAISKFLRILSRHISHLVENY